MRSFRKIGLCLSSLLCFYSVHVFAQTDLDADMMAKRLFCVGPMYSYSSWDHYWEGTQKRDNLNMGTVSTQMLSVMGNYGVSNNLNVLFNIPYVKTKASAGTMDGMKGLQDLSLFVKWRPLHKVLGKGTISLIGVGGYSMPVSNYQADYLPLSIGMHSRNLLARAMVDYQLKNFFVTGSGTYIYRSNIIIDRTAYYTTEMHYTNEVQMPDVASFNFRTGYRSKYLVAEAVLSNWTTLGGFDITRNNMPFPSNRMNSTTAGVEVKWRPQFASGLTLDAGGDYTLYGRNAGQATTLFAGLYYIFNFNHKQTN